MNANIDKIDFSKTKNNFDNSFFILNNTSLKVSFKDFTKQLKKNNPELLKKDYFYLNIWAIMCEPCIDEIPFIDELPKKTNKDLTCVMLTAYSNGAVNNFLKNKNLSMKNFIFFNEMIDFISGIYNEIEVKTQSFPLHVILDKKGNCLAFLFGSIHDDNSAAPLVNFINELK